MQTGVWDSRVSHEETWKTGGLKIEILLKREEEDLVGFQLADDLSRRCLVRSTSTHRDWLSSHGAPSGLDLCWEGLSQMMEGVGSGPQTTRVVSSLLCALLSERCQCQCQCHRVSAGGSAMVFLATR